MNLGPAPTGDTGDGRNFLAGVRVLGGVLGLIAAAFLTALGLSNALPSLREAHQFRQAAIAVGFALPTLGFLAWSVSRPGADRSWLRLGRPRPERWGDVFRAVLIGVTLTLSVAVVCSRLPGYAEAAERQRKLALWSGPGGLAWALAFMAVMPAMTEELLFRGYLLARLERPWGRASAIFAQAALFASLHGLGWPVAAGIGILNAQLTLMTGSLWPGICLHLINNALVLVSMK
jgi:membrane protease YdiL (CAAX protease family)